MRKFLRAVITKVDEAKQEVTGVLAEEVVDKTDELFDYATSKPYFEKWNAEFAEKTEGKSVGNLRAMHKSVVAGKFVSMSYDDTAKKIHVVAKVTVPEQWEQVLEGVYTGFSIGAHVVGKKIKDAATGAWRYTADPFEGSLVDNPCMYGANFVSVKADGTSVEKSFKGGVAMKSKSNVDALLAEAKDALVALSLDEDKAKGLYTVSWFAQICASLNDLAACTQYEAEVEADGSPIPDEIRATAKKLGELLVAYVTEEVAEEAAGDDVEVIVEMSTKSKVIREAGERPVAPADEAGIRPVVKVEETPAVEAPAPAVVPPVVEPAAPAVEVPAVPAAPVVEDTEAGKVTLVVSTSVAKYLVGKVVLEKAAHDELVAKALKVDTLLAENADLNESNAALVKAVESLHKTPAPTAVKLKGIVVEKSVDGSVDVANEDGGEKTIATAKTPFDAIKAIHKSAR